MPVLIKGSGGVPVVEHVVHKSTIQCVITGGGIGLSLAIPGNIVEISAMSLSTYSDCGDTQIHALYIDGYALDMENSLYFTGAAIGGDSNYIGYIEFGPAYLYYDSSNDETTFNIIAPPDANYSFAYGADYDVTVVCGRSS